MRASKVLMTHYCIVGICVFFLISLTDCKDGQVFPFPQLFDLNKRQIKLITETVSETHGRHIVKEYIDLDLGRAAIVTPEYDGEHVLYQNALEDLVYEYQPFRCKLTRRNKPTGWDNERQVFTQNLLFTSSPADPTELQPKVTRGLSLSLSGLAGLWLFAGEQRKVVEQVKQVYSSSQDIYRNARVWSLPIKTMEGDKMKLTAKFNLFYPEENKPKSDNENPVGDEASSLELVQIESEDNSKVQKIIKLINVLSIDFEISDEERQEYLEPPVGYGCFSSEIDEKFEQSLANVLVSRQLDLQVWSEKLRMPSEMALEVSATKFGDSCGAQTDTINVEIAHSRPSPRSVKSVRVKDGELDMKTIYNHLHHVAYKLDLRRGSCELSHLDEEAQTSGDSTFEHAKLKFKNGLQLDLNYYAALLTQTDGFHFIKKQSGSSSQIRQALERHYYESTVSASIFGYESREKQDSRLARIVRVYELLDSQELVNHPDQQQMVLHSVTIWLLDALDSSKLLESYQLNVVEWHALEASWPEEARAFDVSDICYLNNNNDATATTSSNWRAMHQNKDFAWIELEYAADARHLEQLAKLPAVRIEQTFHAALSKMLDSDFSRVPRVEMSINERSMIMRALVLDLPPLQFMFKRVSDKTVAGRTDLAEFAPDVEHCARLCRLHHCTAMVYCTTHTCLTHTQPIPSESEQAKFLDASNKCDSWLSPDEGLHWKTLHHLLARLRHTDFDTRSLGVPKPPDELSVPADESGLSAHDLKQINEAYQKELVDFFATKRGQPILGELLLTLTLTNGRSIHLTPSRFELESDPMHEFRLDELLERERITGAALDDQAAGGGGGDEDNDDDDDDSLLEPENNKMPTFHQGIAMTRLKLAVGSKGKSSVETRQLGGLTHDQCALACKDSRCGVFSYCTARHECVLSSASSSGEAISLDLVEQDVDCYLMERDFLSSYTKFERVQLRDWLKSRPARASSASECAFKCASETKFDCLSFEFCPDTISSVATKTASANAVNSAGPSVDQKSTATCYFQTQHHPGVKVLGIDEPTGERAQKEEPICEHYARTYLADFKRFEFRAIAESKLDHFSTSVSSGQSALKCAERCVNEFPQCTAFQMCLKSRAQGLERTCTFILGKVDSANEDELRAVLDETTYEVSGASKWLMYDTDCQLFSLKRSSLVAHVRDLALGGLVSKRELIEAKERSKANSARATSFASSLLDFIQLYVIVALISALIGGTIIILRDSPNHFVRSRVDRLRIVLGI